MDNGRLIVDKSDKHTVYIKGYPDSTVRPDQCITRAEVAMVFFRLSQDICQRDSTESAFSDVPCGAWFSQAVNTLAELGIIPGYEDGTFRPDNPITRAEFAALAARFDALEQVGGIAFHDVPAEHWVVECIRSAYAKNRSNCYEDGAYMSSQHIARAEVVRIINYMLERLPNELPDILINPYIDVFSAHWAFIHMMEASVEHTYNRDGEGVEFWTTHFCPVTGELLIHVDDYELLPSWLQ